MYLELKAELTAIQFDFASLTADKLKNIKEQILKFTRLTFDQVAQLSEEQLTFDNVVQPFIDQEILCESTSENHMLFAILKNVHPDEGVRKEATEADIEYQQLKIECWAREDVYKIFTVYHTGVYQTEMATRDIEDQRFVSIKLRNYGRAGVNLPQETQQEVQMLQKSIAELESRAMENMNNENAEFEYSRGDLKGLPTAWLDSRLLRKGTTEAEDIIKVTLKYPDVYPILDSADNREVRKTIRNAFNNRCKENNLPLLTEMIQKRAKLARLLGFASFTDYTAQIKMAGNYATVSNFLDNMVLRLKDANRKNLEYLSSLAKADSKDPNFEFQGWDIGYYMQKHAATLCAIDHKKIAEYFPYAVVEAGILEIYQQVLGLRFSKSENQEYYYHSDISCYAVFDAKSNIKLGSFILDMFPRDGKFPHGSCEEVVPGSYKNIPIALLICNLAKDEGLTMEDVETFLHEVGHLMHIVCSRRKLASMSGFNIPIDVTEAPSQMLERWMDNPKALKILSKHPETGESLPMQIIADISKANQLDKFINLVRRFTGATFDQRMHQLGENATEESILKLYQQTAHEIIGLPLNTNDATPACMIHMYYPGYATNLYGYMWALSIACDMFETVFAKDPMDPIAGAHYRKTFLEPGATKDCGELLKDFLGRDPIPEPFLSYCGVSVEPKPMVTAFAAAVQQDNTVVEEEQRVAVRLAPV